MPSPGERPQGLLSIIGTGPGAPDLLTLRAMEAIRDAEYVIGNESYLAPLAGLLAGKAVIRSRMGEEVARALEAAEHARDHRVALVSGGDPGVYGMASIALELIERRRLDVRVEVIPGVTAATAAASRLGSPLSGDFAVVSLSDLLTPMDVIERRLHAAFSMGVPVVLYNPRSKGRPHNLEAAIAIAQTYRADQTPIAIVKNAYREGEEIIVSTLAGAADVIDRVDMHATVIIGGEESRILECWDHARGIITPRGYHRKYVY